MSRVDFNQLKEGSTAQRKERVVRQPVFMMHISGKRVLPIFSDGLLEKAQIQGLISYDMIENLQFWDILARAENYDIGAIVLNPFTKEFLIPKVLFDDIKNLPPIYGDVGEGFNVFLG